MAFIVNVKNRNANNSRLGQNNYAIVVLGIFETKCTQYCLLKTSVLFYHSVAYLYMASGRLMLPAGVTRGKHNETSLNIYRACTVRELELKIAVRYVTFT